MRAVPAFLLLLCVHAFAEERPLVLRGAKVYTVSGDVVENGTVVVQGGKVRAVGGPGIAVPEGAEVRDCTGLVLIPGLVDTHSHLGVYSRPSVIANSDGNEMTGPVQGIVRAIDSLHPRDPGFRQALAGGITTANVMPGSGNVMGGQTAYVKLRGKTVEEMLIDLGGGPPGMKMANGENPKRSYGSRNQTPATRMAVAALQREVLLKAKEYREKRDRFAATGEGEKPRRDLALEPVVEILERKRTVHFHTHRSDDILSVLRLADEFGFEVVLHHATEAYLVAGEVAKRGIPTSHTIVDSPGGKPEAVNLRFDGPALTAAAGVTIAINTDDPVTESRLLLRTAALCVRGGLTPEQGLAAVTLNPARMMHLERRVGSIEAGKDADLVLLSGEPFSVYTQVLATWIEGELVFDRSRPDDLRYATGGYHVRARFGTAYPPPAPPLTPAPVEGEAPRAAPRFALRAGVLATASGPAVRDGVVVVEGGRIVAAGKWGEVRPPPGWPVFAAPWVTPGLIDAHASAGLSGQLNVPADQDLQESSDHNQAALRVLDGFNPRERLVRYLLAHGVTLVNAVPGPGLVISGQAGVFRTWADTLEQATVRFPSAMVFNLGEEPKEDRDKAPGTRMGIAAFLRKALAEAQDPPRKKPGEVEVDLDREALARVVKGELTALFVAHREDDLLTAVRIAREFKLRAVLGQATEGYLVAEELAKAGFPVAAAPTMQRAGSLQTFNTCWENPARLADAGVPVAITSGYESYVPKTRVVLFEAGVAAAHGMGWDRALAAVTIDAARILGVDEDYGSLEPGKSATLVCFDGDPFEYTTHVTHVFGDGALTFNASGER